MYNKRSGVHPGSLVRIAKDIAGHRHTYIVAQVRTWFLSVGLNGAFRHTDRRRGWELVVRLAEVIMAHWSDSSGKLPAERDGGPHLLT